MIDLIQTNCLMNESNEVKLKFSNDQQVETSITINSSNSNSQNVKEGSQNLYDEYDLVQKISKRKYIIVLFILF